MTELEDCFKTTYYEAIPTEPEKDRIDRLLGLIQNNGIKIRKIVDRDKRENEAGLSPDYPRCELLIEVAEELLNQCRILKVIAKGYLSEEERDELRV